jgi:hypothetical protein
VSALSTSCPVGKQEQMQGGRTEVSPRVQALLMPFAVSVALNRLSSVVIP